VPVDIEEARTVRLSLDDMVLEDLVVQRLRHDPRLLFWLAQLKDCPA
jgi:hypothetical protein